MEQRNIEAEYDAWVARISDRHDKMESRGQDMFDSLLKIESNGDWGVITRRYALSHVLIYLLHGGDRGQALKHLEEAVRS